MERMPLLPDEWPPSPNGQMHWLFRARGIDVGLVSQDEPKTAHLRHGTAASNKAIVANVQ